MWGALRQQGGIMIPEKLARAARQEQLTLHFLLSVLLCAEGNQKNIQGLDDLVRVTWKVDHLPTPKLLVARRLGTPGSAWGLCAEAERW